MDLLCMQMKTNFNSIDEQKKEIKENSKYLKNNFIW